MITGDQLIQILLVLVGIVGVMTPFHLFNRSDNNSKFMRVEQRLNEQDRRRQELYDTLNNHHRYARKAAKLVAKAMKRTRRLERYVYERREQVISNNRGQNNTAHKERND